MPPSLTHTPRRHQRWFGMSLLSESPPGNPIIKM